MAVTTPAELREHIALAIQVELSTIPVYLYAMYSIEDQESEAALLIRSVVVEEMLHAALATNLLLAVGGTPTYSSPASLPRYPGFLAHHTPPLELRLEPCSQELIESLFLVIEKPELHETLPDGDDYRTLGQFYHALEIALSDLDDSHDLFGAPRLDAQMTDPSFYTPVAYDAPGSGGLVAVTDLASAHEAIHIIVHQGEGVSEDKWADPAHQELTHYAKFLRLADGTAPIGHVAPATINPTVAGLPEEVRPVADLFNAAYRYSYLTMDAIFTAGSDKGTLVSRLYRLMSEVMGPLGRYLMTLPVGDRVAGPTFENYGFTGDPLAEMAMMAGEVADRHDDLRQVVDSITAL
ncbi:MAG: ferritin-like protein [Acidimicrobiia bacterium]|nr:ferritin-like protein [Acidimicrobiia bacterium]